MIVQFLKTRWFILGLIAVPLITIADTSLTVVHPGNWLRIRHGPDFVIVLIFLLSGVALNTRQIRDGITDIKGTLLALLLIFIIAPTIASIVLLFPLQPGIVAGLLLVSAMPTTLSSGVVMTGSAGGNMAHALFITVIASSLAVIAVPFILALLFHTTGNAKKIEIDQLVIMMELTARVILPLFLGISMRRYFPTFIRPLLPCSTLCNQLCILVMVWMAVCAGRDVIISDFTAIVVVIMVVFTFHLVLVLTALWLTHAIGMEKGKRESVIFMGGQKTLPLSVILHLSLFPGNGLALVVCVMHHIIHLVMDAWLIGYLKNKG